MTQSVSHDGSAHAQVPCYINIHDRGQSHPIARRVCTCTGASNIFKMSAADFLGTGEASLPGRCTLGASAKGSSSDAGGSCRAAAPLGCALGANGSSAALPGALLEASGVVLPCTCQQPISEHNDSSTRASMASTVNKYATRTQQVRLATCSTCTSGESGRTGDVCTLHWLGHDWRYL